MNQIKTVFTILLITLALFAPMTNAEKPSINITPGSSLVGDNFKNAKGQIGVQAHIPINNNIGVSAEYHREGNFRRPIHQSYTVMGHYRFRR